MSVESGWGIEGVRCVAVTKLAHQIKGQALTAGSALEIEWDTGDFLLLDVKTDLTLLMSSDPWRDPYVDCDEAQRAVLAEEVGLWGRVPVGADDSLAPLVGATVSYVEPIFGQVSDLVGARVFFDRVVLSVTVMVEGLLELDVDEADRVRP